MFALYFEINAPKDCYIIYDLEKTIYSTKQTRNEILFITCSILLQFYDFKESFYVNGCISKFRLQILVLTLVTNV